MKTRGDVFAGARRRARSLPPAAVDAGARTQAGALAPGFARNLDGRRRNRTTVGAEARRWHDSSPPTDRRPSSPHDPHDSNQDPWAARRIAEAAPGSVFDLPFADAPLGSVSSLQLVTFSGVNDAGVFRRHRPYEELRGETYGCGMYCLRRTG